jgi:hypothetical protein
MCLPASTSVFTRFARTRARSESAFTVPLQLRLRCVDLAMPSHPCVPVVFVFGTLSCFSYKRKFTWQEGKELYLRLQPRLLLVRHLLSFEKHASVTYYVFAERIERQLDIVDARIWAGNEAAYSGYVRMNKKTFESLLEMIVPPITGDSRHRNPISALYLTLRKNWLVDLSYKFPDKQ